VNAAVAIHRANVNAAVSKYLALSCSLYNRDAVAGGHVGEGFPVP